MHLKYCFNRTENFLEVHLTNPFQLGRFTDRFLELRDSKCQHLWWQMLAVRVGSGSQWSARKVMRRIFGDVASVASAVGIAPPTMVPWHLHALLVYNRRLA